MEYIVMGILLLGCSYTSWQLGITHGADCMVDYLLAEGYLEIGDDDEENINTD